VSDQYSRKAGAMLDGLRKIFDRPGPRLVTGQPVHNARHYSRDTHDSALWWAQLDFQLHVPQRTLVGPEIQQYVDEVLAMPWPRWRQGEQWPVTVHLVHGLTAETGTAQYRSGVAHLPTSVQELIVLHELAHHLAPCRPTHAGPFLAALLDLIEHVMNAAAAGAMRKYLALEGISA